MAIIWLSGMKILWFSCSSGAILSESVTLRGKNEILCFYLDTSKPVDEKAQKKTVSQHSREVLQRHQPVLGIVQHVLSTMTAIFNSDFDRIS